MPGAAMSNLNCTLQGSNLIGACWDRGCAADQQRFDAELGNFPEYAQKLKEKAAKKAERKAAKAAAKQKKRKAPGGQVRDIDPVTLYGTAYPDTSGGSPV